MVDLSFASVGTSMLETAVSLEPAFFDYADFPTTDNIVWLLGKSYSASCYEGNTVKIKRRGKCTMKFRQHF